MLTPTIPPETPCDPHALCAVFDACLADRACDPRAPSADAAWAPYLPFRTRHEYLAWRTAWRAAYAELSTVLRAHTRHRPDDPTPAPSWRHLRWTFALRDAARRLLRLRQASKRQAGAQWRAARHEASGAPETR